MRIIQTREELRALATELQVRVDWHEPDEQGLTARVEGLRFDNAGFWPTAEAVRVGYDSRSVEQHVIISKVADESNDTDDIAAINLATLLAWAAER